jgi:quercetin dioxygenase-like cupin family protein
MRQRLTWLVLFSAAIMVTALHYAGNAWATSPEKFTPTTLYKGTFDEIDVFNHFVAPKLTEEEEHKRDVWLSSQKTKGSSDLYVQSNVWDLGGSTGWHTHPGHSLIIVTAGTVTAYEGNDPDCKPHVYTKGMTFVDPGGDHVHIIRNQGNTPAQTIAVQLVPAGAARRIDAADPGNCHF